MIDARQPAGVVTLAELWQHRDLWWMLAWRDLKVRYRQALVGMAWAVLRPVAWVLLVSVLFGWMKAVPSSSANSYAASAFVGLVGWQLFASTVSDMAESLVRNRHLLTRVYFPRVVIPLASATVSFVDAFVALCVGTILWWGAVSERGWPLCCLPLAVLTVVACALIAGLFLSVLQAHYRDVGLAVPFILQVGMWLHPVVYETRAVIPKPWQGWYLLNPLSASLEWLRWSWMSGTAPPVWTLAVLLVQLASGWLLGWWFFHWLETTLADRI